MLIYCFFYLKKINIGTMLIMIFMKILIEMEVFLYA